MTGSCAHASRPKDATPSNECRRGRRQELGPISLRKLAPLSVRPSMKRRGNKPRHDVSPQSLLSEAKNPRRDERSFTAIRMTSAPPPLFQPLKIALPYKKRPPQVGQEPAEAHPPGLAPCKIAFSMLDPSTNTRWFLKKCCSAPLTRT